MHGAGQAIIVGRGLGVRRCTFCCSPIIISLCPLGWLQLLLQVEVCQRQQQSSHHDGPLVFTKWCSLTQNRPSTTAAAATCMLSIAARCAQLALTAEGKGDKHVADGRRHALPHLLARRAGEGHYSEGSDPATADAQLMNGIRLTCCTATKPAGALTLSGSCSTSLTCAQLSTLPGLPPAGGCKERKKTP